MINACYEVVSQGYYLALFQTYEVILVLLALCWLITLLLCISRSTAGFIASIILSNALMVSSFFVKIDKPIEATLIESKKSFCSNDKTYTFKTKDGIVAVKSNSYGKLYKTKW